MENVPVKAAAAEKEANEDDRPDRQTTIRAAMAARENRYLSHHLYPPVVAEVKHLQSGDCDWFRLLYFPYRTFLRVDRP